MLAGIKEIFSICNSLEIQYVSRKNTEPSLTLGPCTGTVSHTPNKEVAIIMTQIKWGKKESCPRTGDIDVVGQGAPQEIGVHKMFTNLCGQKFQVDDTIPQGPATEYLWMERGT